MTRGRLVAGLTAALVAAITYATGSPTLALNIVACTALVVLLAPVVRLVAEECVSAVQARRRPAARPYRSVALPLEADQRRAA